MNILQRLSLLWRRFSPLEEQLIAAVRQVLPAPAQPIFHAQVAAINLVQRLPQWTEIDFYRQRRGKVDWAGIPSFPRTGEFPVAEVRFSVAGRRYKATLTCIGGHIFDFAITPGPKGVAFATWDASAATRLLTDPMIAGVGRAPGPLPDAWAEFLARGGKPPAGWTFHDKISAYRTTVDESEFLILAERAGDEFVMHRIEPPAPSLFHLNSHDGTPEPIRGKLDDFFRDRQQ